MACRALLPVLLEVPGAASVGKLMQAAALLGNPRPKQCFRTALDMLSELPAAKVCREYQHSCHNSHCSISMSLDLKLACLWQPNSGRCTFASSAYSLSVCAC
jgi:hypothetical protein